MVEEAGLGLTGAAKGGEEAMGAELMEGEEQVVEGKKA